MGQRIIRDRWGEPISAAPHIPEPAVSRIKAFPLLNWVWRNSSFGPGMKMIDWFWELVAIYSPEQASGQSAQVTSSRPPISKNNSIR